MECGSVRLSCGLSWLSTVVLAAYTACGGCPEPEQGRLQLPELFSGQLFVKWPQFFIFKLGRLGPIYLFLVKEIKSIRNFLNPDDFGLNKNTCVNATMTYFPILVVELRLDAALTESFTNPYDPS